MIISPLEQFTIFPFILLSNVDITFLFVLFIIIFIRFIPNFLFQKHLE
jgi:hypothetical protein